MTRCWGRFIHTTDGEKMRFWGCLLSFFFLRTLSAQSHFVLSGYVYDSLSVPVEYVNVLGIPRTQGGKIAFSITDAKGRYELSLEEGEQYTIELSHLGYQSIRDTVILSSDKKKDFVLHKGTFTLKEVTVKEKTPPVIVKEDTIIYRTSAFTSGKERKLRETLKKLPGVEVTKSGQVLVHGRKIDKMLVEGKPFFYGGTKLAVDNIPADAVRTVEVLKNYSRVPFLKGMGGNNQTAMNIRLKEEKKRFVFGDQEVGGGIENRYFFHPVLFYYSPAFNLNFIGDLNNTGQKSFTLMDYIFFDGGVSKIFNNPSNFESYANAGLFNLMAKKDFFNQKNRFGALHLSFSPSSRLSVNAFGIVTNTIDDTKQKSLLKYKYGTFSFNENRITYGRIKNLFSISKLELNYKPGKNDDVLYSVSLKASTGNTKNTISTTGFGSLNELVAQQMPYSIQWMNDLEYSKKFSKNHSSVLKFRFENGTERSTNHLTTDEPLLEDRIVLTGDAPYRLNQELRKKHTELNAHWKHHWRLNRLNIFSPVAGCNFSKQFFKTTDYQQLAKSKNPFHPAGFDNETGFRLVDWYAGAGHKVKVRKLTLWVGLNWHQYEWAIRQYDVLSKEKTKFFFSPKMKIKWKILSSESLELEYNRRSKFEDVSYYADRYRIMSFNTLSIGNIHLENEMKHVISLFYSKARRLRGISYYIGPTIEIKDYSIVRKNQANGINRIDEFVYTHLPDRKFSIRSSIKKRINKIEIKLKSNASSSSYYVFLGENEKKMLANRLRYKFSLGNARKKSLDVEVGYSGYYSELRQASGIDFFTKKKIFAEAKYEFPQGFGFSSEYSYEENNINGIEKTSKIQLFQIALTYHKEDSLWWFRLEGNNLFNQSFIRQSYSSQLLTADERIYIQPRMILFKVTYKL